MKQTEKQQPLHTQIYNDIRDLIVNDEYKPDDMLPSENSLCTRYHTTRRTVREALKHLENDGVVYSLPKKGYFVQRPMLGTFTIENSDFVKQSTSELKDISITMIGDEIQRLLRIAPRRIAIRIIRINRCKGEICGAEIKYVPYDKGTPSIENEINYAVFPDPVNEKTYSFRYHARISISSVLPSEDILQLLGCDRMEPLLLIKRLYVTQDEVPIGYSEQYLLQPMGELHGVSGYVQNR